MHIKNFEAKLPMLKNSKIVGLIIGLTLTIITVLHPSSLDLKQLMSTVASAVWGS